MRCHVAKTLTYKTMSDPRSVAADEYFDILFGGLHCVSCGLKVKLKFNIECGGDLHWRLVWDV